MPSSPLIVAALATSAMLALPAAAAARMPTGAVAAHVLSLANSTLSSTGTPASQLIQTVGCTRHRYPRYTCIATFADGSQILWRHVTLTNSGELTVGASSAT
jgi:hypothetical protein